MLEVHRESGGFTPHAPLNRVHPVKFTPVIAKRISLGYPQGVQPGWNLWDYFTVALFRVPDTVLGIRKCSMHHALCAMLYACPACPVAPEDGTGVEFTSVTA